MVKAQSPPRIALAGLNDCIGTSQRCLEGILPEGFPVFLAAIVSPHIVQIGIGYFLLALPAVTTHHHPLDAGSIATVGTAEDTESGNLTGIFRSEPFLYQYPFGFHHPGCHLILETVIFGIGGHLYGTVDEEQAGGGNVAQLSAGLHHHIDTRTSQLLGRDEFQVGDTPEGIPHRLYSQHIKHLCYRGTFRFDKLAAPEGVAHLAGDAVIVTVLIHLNRIVGKPDTFVPSGFARSSLGVDAIEIASRGQGIGVHNRVTARRGLCISAVKRIRHGG